MSVGDAVLGFIGAAAKATAHGRQSLRFWTLTKIFRALPRVRGAIIACAVLSSLGSAGCARIETIDASGLRTVSWALGGSMTPDSSSPTRIVRVEGIGMHQIGSVWSIGLQRMDIVATSPSECQFIILDRKKGLGEGAQLPLELNEICPQRAPAKSWSAVVRPAGVTEQQ